MVYNKIEHWHLAGIFIAVRKFQLNCNAMNAVGKFLTPRIN